MEKDFSVKKKAHRVMKQEKGMTDWDAGENIQHRFKHWWGIQHIQKDVC